jgi:aryl-alcohol dehydrogenase-like predicted oxidoreductase
MMIRKAKLGKNGPEVGRFGYGAMVLEGFYGASEDGAAVKTLVHALKQGMMIDTADAYGNGHNETLIAEAIREYGKTGLNTGSTKAFIASKFGIVFKEGIANTPVPTGWGFDLAINGRPEYVAEAIDDSLKRLELEKLDLWYAHYLDPAVPVEETVEAMAEQVKKGKVDYLGLSNVTADEIRRAHKIHPISAVQFEYSLWRREPELDLLPTLRELGIALVGWSPLGGGFLTGSIEKIGEGDFRNNNPRYQGENFQKNKDRFQPLKDIAKSLGISSAQLALAWLAHQGQDIFPIPGTRKIERIDENNQALELELSNSILSAIEDIAQTGVAEGATLL